MLRWPSGLWFDSKPMTLKLVFTASLFDALQYRISGENKLASLPVVQLGKTFNGIPPSWCGKQVCYATLVAFSLKEDK